MRYLNVLLLALAVLLGGAPLHLSAQVPSTVEPGPYQVGSRDTSFTDASLQTPVVNLRVWYPSLAPGFGTIPAPGNFPTIVFGHGFNLGHLDYQVLCQHLASWGYLVASPDVQNGFSVNHLEYAREMAACLDFMQDMGNDPSSVFYQVTDTMKGAWGHSMGGGAAALLPGVAPDIDAVSGLAAAETNPSAIAALAAYSGPFQAISGDEDNVAPEATNQQAMYNAATGERQWLSIVGGAHCKFTDGPTICDIVSGPGSVTRTFQVDQTKRYVTAFFNYHLKGDMDALPFICGDSVLGAQLAGVVNNETNMGCGPLSTHVSLNRIALGISPNPAWDMVRVKTAERPVVLDMQGRPMNAEVRKVADGWEIRLENLSAGLYMVRAGSASAPLLHQ